MEAWCTRLREKGEGHGLFARALMEEEGRKEARLAALSKSIGLPLHDAYSLEIPKDRVRVIALCRDLKNAGWKISVRLVGARDGRLLFRDVDVSVAKVAGALGRFPRREPCTVRVSPYKEPTVSGTVLVTSGDACLEMVHGPHYWLTKAPPIGVPILRCWYRFPYLSVQHSTEDPEERIVLFRDLKTVVRIALGISIRQLPEMKSSLYAEYHWRSDLGYRFLECSYSWVWARAVT